MIGLYQVELADWNPEEGCVTVRSGKGDKDRTTYLDEGAAAALEDWLALRGDYPGALFHPTVKGGRISHTRMIDQAVLDILRQRGEQAQVSTFSPHEAKDRTFITQLYNQAEYQGPDREPHKEHEQT